MPPISRRNAIAAGMSAAVGLVGCSRKLEDEPGGGAEDRSWVGKTVLPKKPDPSAAHTSAAIPAPPDAKPEVKQEPVERVHALEGAAWTVKAEKDETVQVLEWEGTACWVKKDLVVPLADAIDFYTKAIRDDAKDIYAFNFRGWAKYLIGKPDDAVKDFDEFLKVAEVPEARGVGLSNRGLVLAESGKFEAAFKDLDEAVKFDFLPAVLNRGWAHALRGQYKEALQHFHFVLKTRLNSTGAMNNIAWVLATCPDPALRNGKAALDLADDVCKRTGNREGEFLDTLAAVHAEVGDFPTAVKAQERALEDKAFAKRYGTDAKKRLQLYTDKKPFRSEPLKP